MEIGSLCSSRRTASIISDEEPAISPSKSIAPSVSELLLLVHQIPDLWEQEFTRICIALDPTFLSLKMGRLWKDLAESDPERENITRYCIVERAVYDFNQRYPLCPYDEPPNYKPLFPQMPMPKTPPPQVYMLSSRGKGRSQMFAGAGPDEARPSNPNDPPPITNIWTQADGPIKGSPPPDCYSSPLAHDPDSWSLPCAPEKRHDPDYPPSNPSSQMAEDVPWLGLKPEFRKPAVFKGDPEDINRFLVQCKM